MITFQSNWPTIDMTGPVLTEKLSVLDTVGRVVVAQNARTSPDLPSAIHDYDITVVHDSHVLSRCRQTLMTNKPQLVKTK